MVWIWSMVFDTTLIQTLALYLDFEGAKNILVFFSLDQSFGGCWIFLIGVWYLHLDLNMFTGIWYTLVPNFPSLSGFCRCKEHPCPLSLSLETRRLLEVPDWSLAS